MLAVLERYAWLLFWTGIVILGLGILKTLDNPKDHAKHAAQQALNLAERQRFCDEIRRSALAETMMKTEAIHKMDVRFEHLEVYVTDVWMALPFEQKEKLDTMLQCYGKMGSDGSTLGTYRDYRTGKTVATMGGVFGFRME